jgi:hypothetical protein
LENFQEAIGRIGTGNLSNLNNANKQNGIIVLGDNNAQEEEAKRQEAARKRLITNQNRKRT